MNCSSIGFKICEFFSYSDSSNEKSSICQRILSIVWGIFKMTLFVGSSAIFFIFNPSFSLASVFVGIVFSEQVKASLDKIGLVWKQQAILWTAVIVFAGFMALPATLAAGSILMGFYIGSNAFKAASDAQKATAETRQQNI